jgi:hypothetical protein
MVLPPSLKLHENVVKLHLKKDIENVSYFYLKITLFQESGEKILCSKEVKHGIKAPTAAADAASFCSTLLWLG